MKRLAAALVAAAALAGCAAPRPPANAVQKAALADAQAGARAFARGDTEGAARQYRRALAAAVSIEDFDLAGDMRLNLALVEQRAGRRDAARADLDALLDAPSLYGSATRARAAARKALLYADANDPDAVLQWADTAQSLCGQPCELDAVLADVRARVALDRGDAAGAIAPAAHGVERAAPASAEQANALRLLGRAKSVAGQGDAAAASLERALGVDRALGLPDRIALDLVYAAENERRREREPAARAFYERALAVYEASGNAAAAAGLRALLARAP